MWQINNNFNQEKNLNSGKRLVYIGFAMFLSLNML